MSDAAGSGSDAPILDLDGFQGPLDLLLQLAKTQKVDLARISVLHLVEQYLAAVQGVRLELAADWLVMAAWLAWLKSRLLLPEDPAAAEEGEEAVEALQARLAELDRMRQAAAWLSRRPQVNRDLWGRGTAEDLREIDRSELSLGIDQLLRGYLASARRSARHRHYRPRLVPVWTVGDAINRLQAMLGLASGRDWQPLHGFLPSPTEMPAAGPRQLKAALAGTLIASLELAKNGFAELQQDGSFAPVVLRRRAVGTTMRERATEMDVVV